MNSVKNRKYSLPLRNQDLHGTEKGALEEEPRKKYSSVRIIHAPKRLIHAPVCRNYVMIYCQT